MERLPSYYRRVATTEPAPTRRDWAAAPSFAAQRPALSEMKLYVLAATVAVVALLSDATGACGQGVGWESYRPLVESGVRPALIYDAEGFADMAGGGPPGAPESANPKLLLTLSKLRLAGCPGPTP